MSDYNILVKLIIPNFYIINLQFLRLLYVLFFFYED